jgi:primosomal protein N'
LKEYFGKELKMRKRFSYPPFRKFVKMGFWDKSENKVQNETEKMVDLLKRTGNNEIEIVWPYGPLTERKKGIYQRNILLKIPKGKDIRNLPIRAALGGLRKGWSVDIDPVSLF